MTTVYASAGGHRYHATRDCQPMWSARQHWRFDPQQWVPGMPQVMLTDGRDIQPITPADALAAGKTPCRACYPGAVNVGPSTDDFGHEPALLDGDAFCIRCRDRGHDEHGDSWTYPTLWPCTTATVLGLVPACAS